MTQWALGNELFGGWVRGHVTAEEYSQRAVVSAKAMRTVDPSIQLIAVGEGIFPGSVTWDSTVLRIARKALGRDTHLIVNEWNLFYDAEASS